MTFRARSLPLLPIAIVALLLTFATGCAQINTYLARYVIPPPALQIDGSLIDRFATDIEEAVSGATSTGRQAPIDARLQMTRGLRDAISGRRSRAADVRRLKSEGWVGENTMGHLQAVPRVGAFEDSERQSDLFTLVHDENDDRAIMFQEIGRQTGMESFDRFTQMRRVWAEVIRRKASRGDWIQIPRDEAFYARFQRTPLARRFPAGVGLGQWVRVP
ncbi:DUF1318 domain-containing protein [Candidatus Sumerlaeota bacterium]|nr:DUF1318 domain-containing protein [Candidatus Sumerlaeota bacterium]